MSSTTLILAVTGGILCGASLIGTAMVFYLWWQSTQRSRRFTSSYYHQGPTDPIRQTMPPDSIAAIPSVPSPIPAPVTPLPAGVYPGATWMDGVSGMVAGQRIMVDQDELLMGRSGVCDIQFHDPKVSRQHALLRFYNDEYYIQDMQSTGGTFVNEKRVSSQVLRDQDTIRLGDSVVVFRRQ